MRFANTILETNHPVAFGYEPIGQLSGMKKLLIKGESGKFWAKDFNISGTEMSGLSYLAIIQPTGVTKKVEIPLEYWDSETQSVKPFTKKVIIKEWELLDYERLAKAYELIMALITL